MKKLRAVLLILCTTGVISCAGPDRTGERVRKTERFTTEWKFTLGDIQGAEDPKFDDSAWEILNLPHDWSITEPYLIDNPGRHGTKFMIGGIGWYRKTFTIPEDYADKRVEIIFDGVYQLSTVWINGHNLS